MSKGMFAQWVGLSLVFAVIGLAGCSALRPSPSTDIPTGQDKGDFYTVELHRKMAAPKMIALPLQDQATVQTALEESGAISMFRTMEIEVHRRVPETGRLLKMQVDYDPGQDQVRVEQDYALHPNDRIIVKPASKGALDKVMSQLMGGN